MTEPETKGGGLAAAELALCLAKGRPQGPVPTPAELDALRQGTLADARRRELLTHLAWDRDCFESFRALECAERHLGRIQRALSAERGADALALLLARSNGEVGQPLELDLAVLDGLRTGALAEPQAARLRARLARDPAAFDLLRQLEEAENALRRLPSPAQPERDPLVRWHRLSPWAQRLKSSLRSPGRGLWMGGLGAVALALLILAIVPVLRPPPDLETSIASGFAALGGARPPRVGDWPWWSPGLSPKGLGPELVAKRGQPASPPRPPSAEGLAFQEGVRRGLQRLVGADPSWADALEALSLAPGDCSGADARCVRRQEIYRSLGQWSLLMYWQCRREGVTRDYWDEQGRVHRRLVQGLDHLGERTSLAEAVRGWVGASAQERLCLGVDDLLFLGLPARR